jgi:hypothetical protein
MQALPAMIAMKLKLVMQALPAMIAMKLKLVMQALPAMIAMKLKLVMQALESGEQKMRMRTITARKLEAELRKASRRAGVDDLRPQSLLDKAGELLWTLVDGEMPPQAIADRWIAEQQKWTRGVYRIGGIAVSLPKRPPRPINVVDS